MNWDGFGVYLRITIEVGAMLLAILNAYAVVKLWKRTTLGERFFGTGLLLMQLYILDITREALVQDFGWKWRLLFLLAAQICFIVYLTGPLKSRRNAREYLDEVFHKEDPDKPA